jgi:hypothetical protein
MSKCGAAHLPANQKGGVKRFGRQARGTEKERTGAKSLRAHEFVSFDARQQLLAAALGLNVAS